MLPNVLRTNAADHIPVLAEEVRNLLAVDRDPTVRPYFDRVKAATRGVQMRFLRGDYAIVLSQLAANGVKADAILLDLGLSSMQVDRPERGFSYATDAPLDMRMDPSDEPSAADVVASYDERRRASARGIRRSACSRRFASR